MLKKLSSVLHVIFYVNYVMQSYINVDLNSAKIFITTILQD